VEFFRTFSSFTYTSEQLDKATREVIDAEKYGEYFSHGTGHGFGLGGYEAPLSTGETFTDELGI
jgi:Xaa-Pro aminopeptidase